MYKSIHPILKQAGLSPLLCVLNGMHRPAVLIHFDRDSVVLLVELPNVVSDHVGKINGQYSGGEPEGKGHAVSGEENLSEGDADQ